MAAHRVQVAQDQRQCETDGPGGHPEHQEECQEDPYHQMRSPTRRDSLVRCQLSALEAHRLRRSIQYISSDQGASSVDRDTRVTGQYAT